MPPTRHVAGVMLTLTVFALTFRTASPTAPMANAVAQTRAAIRASTNAAATVLRLRGGGRRRKDWQSPRPGDSDEVYSLESDPEWSVEDESEDAKPVRRAIFDDESDVCSSNDGSESERPRHRQAPRQHSRTRAPTRTRAEPATTKSRSRVRPAARDRREASSSAEERQRDDTDSDPYVPVQRSRRSAEATCGEPRWGTQATDALDAALRGKLATSARQSRGKATGGSRRVSSRRPRKNLEEPSEESSDFRLQEHTSSSSKERRTNSHRTGRVTEQSGLLGHGDYEADSWDRGIASLRAKVAAAAAQPSLPAYVQQPSSSTSEPVPSRKSSTSHTRDQHAGHRVSSAQSSPQGHVPSVFSEIPGQELRASSSLSPLALAEQGISGHYESDADSDSMPADERHGDVAACISGTAVEEVLRGLAQRLKCEGDAVFMTQSSTRVWRGVEEAAPEGRVTKREGRAHAVYSPPSLNSPDTLALAAGLRADLYPQQSTNHQSQQPPKCERPFVASVSTEGVLQGLGAVMSEAVQAVASAGEREDLECAGLSDDLMALARRLDAARKQGECISSLLKAPQRIFGEGDAVQDSTTQSIVRQVELDLRRWHRRAVVSGSWHQMREQSIQLAKSAKLQPSSTHLSVPACKGLGGTGTMVYVGGNCGMSGGKVHELMARCGRVMQLHTTDTYSFVEVCLCMCLCLRLRLRTLFVFSFTTIAGSLWRIASLCTLFCG